MGQLFIEALKDDALLSTIGIVFIPVRDLNTDENTDYDDKKINPDGEPILIFDVFGKSSK